MLFHVKPQHSWEIREGNSTTPSPASERLRWVEGTEEEHGHAHQTIRHSLS